MRLIRFALFALIGLLVWSVDTASAQGACTPVSGAVCMTRTTLSANVTATATTFNVASGTDIDAGDQLYVDAEQMHVVSRSSTALTVRRGVNGTRAEAHDSGDAVLIGASDHFKVNDPDWGQDCTRGEGQAAYLPWINVRTGTIWTCDARVDSEWTATTKKPQTDNSEPTTF